MRPKTSLALLFLLLAGSATGAPTHSPWPGGVAIVDLGDSVTRPTATFDDRPVLVLRTEGRWHGVVGIPLDTEPGSATIRVGQRDIVFDVVEHAYPEEHLQVAKSYVSLSEADLARYHRERQVIDAALNNWRDAPVESVRLLSPVDGRRSSSFGKRRFFNNEPRSPHTGMDIAAPEGTPIEAPRGGVVTETGDFYFNGNSVFVDHGQGFVTMYCHLSEIGVETLYEAKAHYAR